MTHLRLSANARGFNSEVCDAAVFSDTGYLVVQWYSGAS